MLRLPPLSDPPPPSEPKDYVQFAHAHALLRERIGDPSRVDVPALAAHIGYRKLHKVRDGLDAWTWRPGRIPRGLLDFFGLELEELQAAVDRDHAAWVEARSHVKLPSGFVTRVAPGFYPYSDFPPEVTTWEECLEFLALLTELDGFSHLTGTPAVSAVFWPGEEPRIVDLDPRLVVWKKEIRFQLGEDPERIVRA